MLETLNEGDIYDGVISSIADFGAFVDLGGADGLIHLSELSWNRVNHPSEVVEVGEKIKVQILSVDQERRRIGLSLRRLQPQPWDVVDQTYEVGQIVRGRITKLVNFGAFARLEKDGIEGLIHVSELTEQRIGHPREIVTEGQEYDLRIIRIDMEKRRMGLSLKQAMPGASKTRSTGRSHPATTPRKPKNPWSRKWRSSANRLDAARSAELIYLAGTRSRPRFLLAYESPKIGRDWLDRHV